MQMATYAEPISDRRASSRRRDEVIGRDIHPYLVPVGRALFAAIFLLSVPGHFTSAYIGLAGQAGVPMANIVVPLSGLLLLLGGLSVLLGFHARIGAWLLFLFLISTAFMMHNFWAVSDPVMRAMQQAHFMKNLAMAGAALLIAYWGAGPISLDRRRLMQV
jgi:putative oxidoreductase